MKPSKKILYELTSIKSRAPRFAFLPYKAAMWDCMEPLYLECQKCGFIADLIPLYYYTFPDRQIHIEASAFEKYGYKTHGIELLDSNSYDYLVIHYPYDGCNNVTKLLPNEYTAALKKYGKIVYIPYHGNIAGPEWSRFFTMPGAVESDFICLGSQQDVDVFKKVNPSYSGIIIQTEYSTKYEYALNHADDPIPDCFKNVNKTIVLICGTLWTFTHDPVERMKKHMDCIQRSLDSNQFVIYRPHPLVYEAIAVMQPKYLEMYENFIADVKKIAYVDESPFLQQAIAAADIMLCDPSSVIRTWYGAGKPFNIIE